MVTSHVEIAMAAHKDLTAKFRHVRLLLAREKGHPEGDRQEGYDLLVPLDEESRLDVGEWRGHKAACRVRRFHPDQEDRIGLLRRKAGAVWYFDYAEGEEDDEIGFRLGEERFATGEYLSVGSVGAIHTYRVARVEKP
jgi:hypothetical protein